MRLNYRRLDVFTDEALGGNPLAVFLDVPELTTAKMQAIAREMNLSESVFVSAERSPGVWPVRIFTPGVELPFAGHPTVGTAVALVLEGWCGEAERPEFALLEAVGRVPVTVVRETERLASATLTVPRLPEFGQAELPATTLAALLGVEAVDILDGDWRPRSVSCGVPFYVVALRSLDAIRRVKLRRDVWEQHLSNHWAPHLYVVTPNVEREGSAIHARMFPPAMGVDEDPATGGAAAALAGYLFDAERPGDGPARWRIEQGFEMGRPSLIDLEIDVTGGQIATVRLTGSAVAMGGGHLVI